MKTRDGLAKNGGPMTVLYDIHVLDVSFPVERARGLNQTGIWFPGSKNDNDEMNRCRIGNIICL